MPTDENSQDQSQNEPAPQKKEPDVSAVANAAAAAHVKRLADKLDEKFNSITQVLEALKQKPAPEPESGKKGKKDDADPELVALRQKLDEVQNNFTQAQKRAEEAERKRREDQTRSDVIEHLRKNARADMAPFLADYLLKATNKIEYDTDGTPLFRHRMSPGQGMAEEDVLMPLTDGLDAYLKSDSAKPFLPAPASGAAPKTPAATRVQRQIVNGKPTWDKPAANDQERIQRAMAMEEWIKSQQNKL